MGAESGEIAIGHRGLLLATFVRQHRLGHVYDSQTGFQCFPARAEPRSASRTSRSSPRAGCPDEKSPEGPHQDRPRPGRRGRLPERPVRGGRGQGQRVPDRPGSSWSGSSAPESKTVLIRRRTAPRRARRVRRTVRRGRDPGFTCKVADLFVYVTPTPAAPAGPAGDAVPVAAASSRSSCGRTGTSSSPRTAPAGPRPPRPRRPPSAGTHPFSHRHAERRHPRRLAPRSASRPSPSARTGRAAPAGP